MQHNNSLSSNSNFLACCSNTDNNITQWKDLENDRGSSLLLKPSSNLELLVNQFNNVPQKMVMTLKKLFLLNIMTLMKCITLKYLTKVNRFPYSM